MLTTTMVYMKNVIDALEEAGLRDQVKVMIGADLYTVDASSAAEEGKKILN